MKNARATRQDVAKLAGVSTTTVTNVINNRKNVSDDVKERVRQVMKEIQYKPNLIARSLITQQTHHLALLIEDISDLHHSIIVDSFQKEAVKNGYFVSICIRNDSLEDLFDSFISRGVDGVFMMIAPSQQRDGGFENTLNLIRRLASNGIKVVVGFNCYHDIEHFSSLEGDFGGAVASAVEYLVSLGHQHIGLLNIFDKDYPFDNRYEKFVEAMERNLGVKNPPVILGRTPYPGHIETGEEYTKRLLELHPEVTAIIGSNDMLSIGAVSYLNDNGYHVPGDMSVVSIGDVSILRYFKPAITAMSLNFVEYGKAAFKILLDSIQTGNAHVVLHKLSLHTRATTAPPPSAAVSLLHEALSS